MEYSQGDKKLLFIGSTCVDVRINIDHLPATAEDVNVDSQHMALGGCAFNASEIARLLGVPYTLFSPVGTGAYGDFVRHELTGRGVCTPIPPVQRDNGCCYCFVERGGERTFLSYHGAEYAFDAAWFDALDACEYDMAYVCGLEIEEPTGAAIIDFLEHHRELTVFFAPGSRISHITHDRMMRLLALHPVLHLNEEEVRCAARELCGVCSEDPTRAADAISGKFDVTVVVTLGADGCLYERAGERGCIASEPVHVVDTIGAGDSHVGAMMCALKHGLSLEEALRVANRVAAATVQTAGATPDARFLAGMLGYCGGGVAVMLQ